MIHALQTPSADFALLLWLFHFHAITVSSADAAELYDVSGSVGLPIFKAAECSRSWHEKATPELKDIRVFNCHPLFVSGLAGPLKIMQREFP